MLDAFQSQDHSETGTVRLYRNGHFELMLALNNWQKRRSPIATNLNPTRRALNADLQSTFPCV
jgi:hypothetical protein